MTTDQNGAPEASRPSGIVPEVQEAFDKQQARFESETQKLREENERLQQAAALGEGSYDLVKKAMEHPQLQEALTRLHQGEALPENFGAPAPDGNPSQGAIPGIQPTPPTGLGQQTNGAGPDVVTKKDLADMFRTYHQGLMNDIRPVAETIMKKQGDDDVKKLTENYPGSEGMMKEIADYMQKHPGVSHEDAYKVVGIDRLMGEARQKGEEAGLRRAMFSPTLEPTSGGASTGGSPANPRQAEVDKLMKVGQTEDATRVAMQAAIEALGGG